MIRGFPQEWAAFGRRIAGAMRLSRTTYHAIAHDPRALPQAVAVILLSSVSSAIVFLVTGGSPGLTIDVDWGAYPITREHDAAAALAGGVLDGGWGLLVWAVQTSIIWLLWNRFSARRHNWGTIAAPLGFANAPLIVFALLEALPVIGGALGVVGLVWTLVASVVAVRVALDTGWGRTIGLLAISIVVLLLFSIAVSKIA